MIVHKKMFEGYRAVDEKSGLIVCSNCSDLLNQECQAPYDGICPCCRFEINMDKMAQEQGWGKYAKLQEKE